LYGAVNTIINNNGRLVGYNTDGYGFIKAFEVLNIPVDKQNILLLGAGGSARAVLCELLQRHCHVTIVNRTVEKAEKLQRELAGQLPGKISICTPEEIQGSYDCLVNTTPIGMGAGAGTEMFPINPNLLSQIKVVYDLIYNPYETRLLQEAKKRGCITINGFPMLFYQAMESNRIWLDVPVAEEIERQLYCQIEQYLKAMQQQE